MQQLFLCYRRAGAQTAKLFSFYMSRNHPEIRVWYSDREREGNYKLDIPALIQASYGAVIFLSRGFTRGFLDREGRINVTQPGEKEREECVTVQEIIWIEKALQERRGFELHIVNLDGATLTLADRRVLESVFRQAGILTPESVAHFSQRNQNAFDTARDHEDIFFDRMAHAYLPNGVQTVRKGNFSIGNYSTSVDVLCWDCRRFIPPRNITFELDHSAIALYDRVELAPVRGAPPSQDDDTVSLVRFDQDLTTNDEQKSLRISCQISKYHLFKKALDLWNRNGFDMSGEVLRFLNGREEDRLYPIPNAMGLALMVVTADDKLVFSRRSSKRRVRSNEFDCSIVEGLLPRVSRMIGGTFVQYDLSSPDYIERECRRAFCEEICTDGELELSLFGLILDIRYGQWNLTGMLRSGLTAEQIQAAHPTRDDTTEVNRLYFVSYLDSQGRKSLDAVKQAVMLYKAAGMWDTALTALCGTLSSLGFPQSQIDRLL